MPPSSNSELGLSGLITSRLHGTSGQERNLNLTSDSDSINGRQRGSTPVTVSPREQLPTLRGRQTQAAIDAAARAVIARKGILATTISDIAAEAGKSTASFYNYYDSKEAMVREWAVRFRDEARVRSQAAAEPGLTNWERSYKAAAAHWNTYRNRLAEIISVSQLAMISDDFAEYWTDICSFPIELITHMV